MKPSKNGNNNNERSSHWRMRFQQWICKRRNKKRKERVGENEQWKQSDSCVQQKKKQRVIWIFQRVCTFHTMQSVFFVRFIPNSARKFFESSLNPANTNKWTTTFRAENIAHRAKVLFIILHVVFDSLSCTRSFLSQSRAFSQTAINHFYIRNVLIMIIKPCE